MSIRVAFTFAGSASRWTGGYNYLSNALDVLRTRSADICPVLFVSPSVRSDELALFVSLLDNAPVQARWLHESHQGFRSARTLLTGMDREAWQAFDASQIDVVFEAGQFFGTGFPLPALTWVADFQSHHFPENFSPQSRWRTYLGRRLQLRGNRLILLSSQDAARDCLRFYPRSKDRTVVVPFAVPQPQIRGIDESLGPRLGISGRFIYLPNQFWKHKNHMVVLEALAIIRRRLPELTVVASGSANDHRHPHHFSELQRRVQELDVGSMFQVVGLVARADVIQLAVRSVAMLNPSLFEGWSTTVEEAKAMGVPLVLSDIPVHREQARGAALYFNPTSPAELANALQTAWNAEPLSPLERLAAVAQPTEQRVQEYAVRLSAALHAAAALRR